MAESSFDTPQTPTDALARNHTASPSFSAASPTLPASLAPVTTPKRARSPPVGPEANNTNVPPRDQDGSLTNWLQASERGIPNDTASSDIIPPRQSRNTRQYIMSHSDSEDSQSSAFDDSNRAHQDDARIDGIDDIVNSAQMASIGPTREDNRSPFDLKAPQPSHLQNNIELLTERLFSADHLKHIFRDNASFARYQSFLAKYRSQSNHLFQRYLEAQKAVCAVEYANAVASHLTRGHEAAQLDRELDSRVKSMLDALVEDTLPGYVTHRLVQLTTEALVKEITGQNTPIMRDMVRGLAEVYCLTDPSLPDNPIVYASEEFYRCTQYGREYVIGRNCRFLQGPRTSDAAVQRLIDALADGTEVCETILNYRRDGSPFVNLLMIAPLFDNKGTVRYFIGAQVDINGLIEDGRGMDSFEKLLKADRASQRYGGATPKTSESVLQDLSMMMDPHEVEVVRSHGRERRPSDSSSSGGKNVGGRRYFGLDTPNDTNLWPAAHLGSSGRLPGVFQNYLLVRPYPSLRITFTSPALRIPGLLQSKFMDRISGPSHIRDGILSAFSSGIGVTAKISWLPTGTARAHVAAADLEATDSPRSAASSRDGNKPNPRHEREGKPRWIHCTPLLGSDERVGVWMVVMVESESITGALNAHERAAEANAHVTRSLHDQRYGTDAPPGVNTPKYNSQRMFKEYLRREGRADSTDGANGAPTAAGQSATPGGGSYPTTSAVGSVRSKAGDRSRADEKAAKARIIADRVSAGEDQFRDF